MKKKKSDLSEQEEKYDALIRYFGKDNLKFEFFNEKVSNIEELDIEEILNKLYINIKLTHLPSGKVFLGKGFDSQIENSISAMKELKESLACSDN